MKVPAYTIELIRELKQLYPDTFEVDPKVVGTPEYWMYAGIVDLIRKLETHTTSQTMKEV